MSARPTPPQARKVTKVLLVHSAHHAEDGTLVQAKKLIDRFLTSNVAEMALPLLAAYTPPHIQVEKIEDYFDDMPWDTSAQVVGISAQMMMRSRAVEIAGEFRRRGKVVIMGGFLPTMHPEAVRDHVDAICIGDADLLWATMLEDVEKGTLQPVYRSEKQPSLENMPTPRYDLIKRDRFVSFPVQATRGCPFTCDYCSIIQLNELTYRYRPIEHIVRDIRATRSKYIHFTDDNLMENRAFAKELFRAMKGLGVEWISQVTINCSKDEELLRLAYEAGCRGLALGVETLSQKNLESVNKGFNTVEKYSEAFSRIQDIGIAAHALIVFGLPEDTPKTFDDTVDFLISCNVAVAEFFIFTPYPKTPAGKRVLEAGQIVDHDINHYRETYVVFRHPTMTSQQIIEGYWRAFRRFYAWKSVLRRLWGATCRNKFFHFMNNFYYWSKIQRGIVPVYFGKGNPVPPVSRK